MAASKMHDDLFFHEVRMLQRKTRCSNFVCNEFVRTYRKLAPPTSVKKSIHDFDSKSKRAAGCNYIVLHGCPQCNRHVYLPTDKETRCPVLKKDGTICGHARFDDKGQPFEVMFCFATHAVVICLAVVFAYICLHNICFVYFIFYSLASAY